MNSSLCNVLNEKVFHWIDICNGPKAVVVLRDSFMFRIEPRMAMSDQCILDSKNMVCWLHLKGFLETESLWKRVAVSNSLFKKVLLIA
ncbi:hypothetical protein PS15p_200159 [Mucor circinelloides]